MKNKKMFVIAALAAVLVSCGKKQGMPNFGDNEYAVTAVKPQSTELKTSYPATIKGVQDVEIRPKVSGFITEIKVQEGQAVKKGQVLFVIDNVTFEAAVRQAKAAVNSATAQRNTAKLTYENSKKLSESKVIGDFELQSAQNSYESAEAALAQAEANYVSAKQNLDFCYVTSPVNGVVGTLPLKVGALVSASNLLTNVADISTMEVYFSMTEKDILELGRAEGGVHKAIADYPPVKLQLADGTVYNHDGKVAAISGVIDQATGAVQVRVDFPNPEHLLKSGGAGSVIIPHTDNQALLVPQDAVVQIQDKYFVYLVGKDNKVKQTEITVYPNNDGKNYLITGGLKAGDNYVCAGVTTLTDDKEIVPITPEKYKEKLKKATELGAAQGDASKLKEALGGK